MLKKISKQWSRGFESYLKFPGIVNDFAEILVLLISCFVFIRVVSINLLKMLILKQFTIIFATLEKLDELDCLVSLMIHNWRSPLLSIHVIEHLLKLVLASLSDDLYFNRLDIFETGLPNVCEMFVVT